MKAIKAAVSLPGVFLLLLVYSEAEPARWKILQESTYGGTFSYDMESVKRTPDNTVTARAKTEGAEYLYEIDCKNRRARLLDDRGSEWFGISPGSGDELLYKAVCP